MSDYYRLQKQLMQLRNDLRILKTAGITQAETAQIKREIVELEHELAQYPKPSEEQAALNRWNKWTIQELQP